MPTDIIFSTLVGRNSKTFGTGRDNLPLGTKASQLHCLSYGQGKGGTPATLQ